ncbi:primosomal protein N' [Candidatus Gracilibacteria bacterium]|nr:primosomal protein N' [Candidatus Gracilibacteria bacterium]
MNYCDVWIRGIKGIFSWQSKENINIGARVRVKLRGKLRTGIILKVSKNKPEFKTQDILEVWDEEFIPSAYIEIAREVAEENFSSLEKVLSLTIPEKFFSTKNPEKRNNSYALQIVPENIRGEKQKQAVEIIQKNQGIISEEELRKDISLVTIKGLIEKGIITEKKGKITSIFSAQQKTRPSFTLTVEQQKVVEEIRKSKKPVLLFGVTGSGKTEIYKKLAAEVSEDGQVLFLVPEIALTPQLIAELYSVFGDILAVWHSKLSEGEKVQEWSRIQSGEARILIGARSAVMIPLVNPKLVILDEEHEWTFKNEFAPRFQTHDIVEKIVSRFNAKLVLGTATPRLESFHKCEIGEWHRVDLPNRVHEVQLPEIEIIDLSNEAKKGNFSPISDSLEQELREILKQKKQAMIFLNKRGFAGSTMCKVCGHTFECPNCTSNMKMHERFGDQKFICHVCGHLENFVVTCPECEAENFQFKGWGTQALEKELKERFPGIKVFRADADSVSGKQDFEKLMDKFHEGQADVLLGTQMIAKGLDFDNVELVGVILADVGLNLPDFRSEERVFQLLTQVSGRAGRRKKRGRIVVQTFRPEEKIFQFVRHHDSEGFLQWQSELRKKSNMPPFSAMAKITFSDVKKEVAFKEAKKFFNFIKDNFKDGCYLAPAFFPRTHNKYHFHVFIREENKEKLIKFLKQIEIPENSKVDINPASLL